MQNFTKAERIAAAVYFIWFFIQLGFLFYSEDSTDSSLFWPFTSDGKSLKSTYDAIEFIIYIGVPLILFIAYKIVFDNNHDESYGGRRHSVGSFLVAFLDEKIKAEELIQQVNQLSGKPVNYDHLNELKNDREKAANTHVNAWLDRLEVKKKYKEFENK